MKNIENQYVMVGSKRNCKPFKMSYKTYGNGPNKVLFVMGFQSEGKYWSNILGKYMQEPEKYTICIFDQCGTGSSGYSYFSTFNELASDMVELLNHLKWDKAHVIALSTGCSIAWELASMKPDLIKSLNMISIPAFGVLSVKALRQLLMLPLYSRLYCIKKQELFTRLLVSDSFLYSPSKIKKGLNIVLNKELVIPLANKMHDERYGLKYMSRFSHAIAFAFYKPKPMDINLIERKFPIVNFIGTDDPFVPKSFIDLHIKLFKPNLIYMCRGAGHCLHVEDPERFNKLSMEFIDSANHYKSDSIDSKEKNQFFETKFLHFNSNNKIPSSNDPFPLKNSRLFSFLPKIIKNFIK
ncbi:hypothetical protein ACTFIZ_002570 [Dictyostelium cf. discoideum]